jgi:hypothetical protein
MADPAASYDPSQAPRHRAWRGQVLHPIDEAYMFFNDEGPVPETLRRLQKHLTEGGIPHIFIGATALNAYHHERMTRDIDVCVRLEDLERFRREFVGKEYQAVQGRSRRFYDPVTQVTVDMLVAGELAGNTRKQRKVRFPDPAEAQVVEHVPVPSLPRLIELKLVTWRYKDWADVVDLIRNNALDESFAEQLDPVVRSAYVQCYDQKVEEDRYNPESDDQPPEA